LFSNYYRVAFFGKQWRDLQGKEFVYRANDTVRLNDFTTRLKVASSPTFPHHLASLSARTQPIPCVVRVVRVVKQSQFSSKFGDKVEILGNISVDLAKLKEDVCYFQVVSLTEYFDAVDLTSRPNLWDRKFNLGISFIIYFFISLFLFIVLLFLILSSFAFGADVARELFTDQFIFESPFTKSGKAHGDLADQCKRKTILRTAKAFPFVKSRLPVIEKKEVRIMPDSFTRHTTHDTRHTAHDTRHTAHDTRHTTRAC
jgi:hypothetical protein